MVQIKKLVGCALSAGLSAGCVFIFSAEGPYIGIHLLGFTPSMYGLIGLLPYLGTLIGAFIVIKTTHIEPRKMLKASLILELIAAVSMLICFVFHVVNVWTLLAPTGFFFAGNVMFYGTAAPFGIRQSSDKANASAMVNFLALGTAMISTMIFGTLHSTQPWFMPAMFLGSWVLIVVIYFLLIREKTV